MNHSPKNTANAIKCQIALFQRNGFTYKVDRHEFAPPLNKGIFMKKIILSFLPILIIGCSSVSEQDLQYAKDRAYCSGMGYASETLGVINNKKYEHIDQDTRVGIAIARLLTNKSDEVLIDSFNKGYAQAKEEIYSLLKANKSKVGINTEVLNEVSTTTKGANCLNKINLYPSTYEKLGKYQEADLGEFVIEDLSKWIK